MFCYSNSQPPPPQLEEAPLADAYVRQCHLWTYHRFVWGVSSRARVKEDYHFERERGLINTPKKEVHVTRSMFSWVAHPLLTMTPALLILLTSSIAVVYGGASVSLRGGTVKSFITSTDEQRPGVAMDSLFIEDLSSFLDVTITTARQPSPLPSYVKCRIGLPADCADETKYCAIPPGVCTTMSNTHHGPMTTNDDIFGQCKTRPKFCNRMYAPVCGCDGKAYSNSCVAASAGVNVKHEGECREECVYRSPGRDNCTNANEYCVIDERYCMLRIYEQKGYCETKSIDCSSTNNTVTAASTTTTTTTTTVDEPVCGCDFNTYKNACLAHNAGINIMHNGVCNASDSDDGDNDNTVPTNDDVPKYLSLKSRISILTMAAICYAVFLFMIYYSFVALAAVTDREQARRAMRSSNRSTGRRGNVVSSSTTTSTTAGSTRHLEVALLSR